MGGGGGDVRQVGLDRMKAGDQACHLLVIPGGHVEPGQLVGLLAGARGKVAELPGDGGIGLVAGAGDVLGDVGAQLAEVLLAGGQPGLEAHLAGRRRFAAGAATGEGDPRCECHHAGPRPIPAPIDHARTLSHGGAAPCPAATRSIVPAMSSEDPSVEDLRRRQRSQERAEAEQVAEAATPADAARHQRRAEKARYLREKLEEREQSEREAGEDPDLPPAA
jgi:hypothetical protein